MPRTTKLRVEGQESRAGHQGRPGGPGAPEGGEKPAKGEPRKRPIRKRVSFAVEARDTRPNPRSRSSFAPTVERLEKDIKVEKEAIAKNRRKNGNELPTKKKFLKVYVKTGGSEYERV